MRKLPNIHPGEVLLEEFLTPMGISQNALARAIGVPPRRINEIVLGKRAITADTAVRLAHYFGTSEQFWMALQASFDLEEARKRLGGTLPRLETMRHLGLVLLTLVILGCGGVKQAPPAEPPKSVSQAAAEPQAVAPAAPVAEPPSAPPPSPPSSPTPPSSLSAPSPPIAATPPVPAPPAKAPAKAATPVAPAAKKEAAVAADTKQQAAAPLDLTSLETRLKDTKAIGVLTKLTLKNQVDDLLNQFRSFYQGKLKTTLAELRRPYDLLILKVLSLLQDKDPSLAADLSSSREAIWGILSDPVKFAKI